MKPNELMKTMIKCTEKNRFAILKALSVYSNMTYSEISNQTSIPRGGKFGYYLRVLVRNSVIQKNSISLTYSITQKGTTILNLLENTLQEKFISDEKGGACSNSDDGNHEFKTMCVKCSYTKKDKK